MQEEEEVLRTLDEFLQRKQQTIKQSSQVNARKQSQPFFVRKEILGLQDKNEQPRVAPAQIEGEKKGGQVWLKLAKEASSSTGEGDKGELSRNE